MERRSYPGRKASVSCRSLRSEAASSTSQSQSRFIATVVIAQALGRASFRPKALRCTTFPAAGRPGKTRSIRWRSRRWQGTTNSPLLAVLATLALSIVPALAVAQEAGTRPEDYSGPAWSPYVVGALIGVLSMFTFYFSNKPLGASTAYARLAGMLGLLVAPRHTRSLKFYQDKKPVVDWEVMLLVRSHPRGISRRLARK